jgi:formylglycine-generating enzyme required for sulfatase activity
MLEDEFERAARGWDNRSYPWGNDWVADRDERRRRPSPWGIYDLCGEVWQWCQDELVADRSPQIQSTEGS